MKSIKEKRILVKWARAMNEPVDPALAEEVERYDQLQREVTDSIKSNTIKDLIGAAQGVRLSTESTNMQAPAQVIKIEYPKPPSLYELELLLQEVQHELVQAHPAEESFTEQAPAPEESTTTTEAPNDSLIERTSKHITQEVKNESQSYQQPDPELPGRSIDDLRKKIKYLEAWISKIASTGPGSGEVNLLRLDDVDISAIGNGKVLAYNAATAKMVFQTGGGGSANLTSVTTAIIPDADSVYDIGTANLRWGTLYLANNSINLGGSLITSDGAGIILPASSRVTVDGFDKPFALVSNTGAVATVVPFFTEQLGLNTIATNFTFGANPDGVVFTNFTFSNGSTIAQSARALFYF